MIVDLSLKAPRALIAAASAMIALIASFTNVEGDQSQVMRKYGKEEYPVIVLNTFHKSHKKCKVIDAEKEVRDSIAYYKFEYLENDIEKGVLYYSDGKICETSEIVAFSSLPKEVAAGLLQSYPLKSIQESEIIHRGKMVEYEFEIEDGKDRLEVRVDAAGRIVRKEVLPDESQEDDD